MAMGLAAAIILGSGFLGCVPRFIVWALFGMAWIGGMCRGAARGVPSVRARLRPIPWSDVSARSRLSSWAKSSSVRSGVWPRRNARPRLSLSDCFGFWWIFLISLVGDCRELPETR